MRIKEAIKTAVHQKSKIVPYNDMTIGYCQCTECPTHEQCKRDEVVFCSAGESANRAGMTAKSCICGECEVFKRHGLATGYFCMNGEAK